MADLNVAVKLAAVGASAAARDINKVGGSVDGLGKSATGSVGALGKLGSVLGPLGVAGAAVAAGAALVNMTRLAAEEQAGIARLTASLGAAGISYGANEAAINRVIEARENLSFADDQQRESLSRLVQVTGDLTKAQDLQRIAMDLARGTGMSLVDASILLGKVQGGNVGILKRYGVAVAEGATATEALAAVQAKFAGQSEAFAATAAGQWERFNNELGNVQESIGTGLLPVLTEVGIELSGLLQELQDSGALEAFGEVIGSMVLPPLRAAVDVIGLVKDAITTLSAVMATVAQAAKAAMEGDFEEAFALAQLAAERGRDGVVAAADDLVSKSSSSTKAITSSFATMGTDIEGELDETAAVFDATGKKLVEITDRSWHAIFAKRAEWGARMLEQAKELSANTAMVMEVGSGPPRGGSTVTGAANPSGSAPTGPPPAVVALEAIQAETKETIAAWDAYEASVAATSAGVMKSVDDQGKAVDALDKATGRYTRSMAGAWREYGDVVANIRTTTGMFDPDNWSDKFSGGGGLGIRPMGGAGPGHDRHVAGFKQWTVVAQGANDATASVGKLNAEIVTLMHQLNAMEELWAAQDRDPTADERVSYSKMEDRVVALRKEVATIGPAGASMASTWNSSVQEMRRQTERNMDAMRERISHFAEDARTRIRAAQDALSAGPHEDRPRYGDPGVAAPLGRQNGVSVQYSPITGQYHPVATFGASELEAYNRLKAAGQLPRQRSVPSFAGGGVVPGPRGAPMMAMVHGGERISQGGGAPVVKIDLRGAFFADERQLRRTLTEIVQRGVADGSLRLGAR